MVRWVVHTNFGWSDVQISKNNMHILITTHPTWLHHLGRLDMDFGERNSWVAVGPVFGNIWVAQSFHRSHWRPGDRLAIALVYHRVYSPLEPFHVLSVRNVHHLFFDLDRPFVSRLGTVFPCGRFGDWNDNISVQFLQIFMISISTCALGMWFVG